MKILKPILVGALIGAALFFMPFFVLRIAVGFFIIFGLIRLFSRRRYGRGFGRPFYPAFTDSIRNMSDTEYQKFKASYGRNCGRADRNHAANKETEKGNQ